jgi:3-oxoacyl-[acyl-carrier-protein] synthase-3
MPGGGASLPATHETVEKRQHFIKMAGREVFKYAVRAMTDAAVHALRQADVHSAKDIDLLIPHQANTRIISAIAHRLHIPDEKVYVNIQEYGNTSSASIPIALDEARKNGVLKEGMKCLLVAFGGGFTWGSSLIQF